jgi:hypothetical protein
MKNKLLAVTLFAAGSLFAQISLGIHIGRPPAPRVVAVPASPGPGYLWIAGYWYPVNGRYVWHNGYWSRPPYEGAYWVAPHHDGRNFYAGFWDGPRGRFEHDHRWDRDRDRDYRREHDDHR